MSEYLSTYSFALELDYSWSKILTTSRFSPLSNKLASRIKKIITVNVFNKQIIARSYYSLSCQVDYSAPGILYLRFVLQAKGVSIAQLSTLHFPQSGSAWMATQSSLRFLAKNEGSPGAHLRNEEKMSKETSPTNAPLTFGFLKYLRILLYLKMKTQNDRTNDWTTNEETSDWTKDCSLTRSLVPSFLVQSFVRSLCVFIFMHNNIRRFFRVWPCVGHRAVLVCPLVDSLMAKIRGSDPKLREAEYPTNLSDSSGYPSALFLSSDTKQMSSFHFLAV